MPNRQAKRGRGKHHGTRADGRWAELAEERRGDKHERGEARAAKQACVKTGYATMLEAVGVIDEIRARLLADAPPDHAIYTARRAYVCNLCGGWHITSQKLQPRSRQPSKRYQCFACKEYAFMPGKRGLGQHRHSCERYNTVRNCGVCQKPLPLAYPLTVKYHRASCSDAVVEAAAAEMTRAGKIMHWSPERIDALKAVVGAERFAQDAAPKLNLSAWSLRQYVVGLRSDGVYIPRLTWWPRRSTAPVIVAWPYIIGSPTSEHELMLLVNRAVSKHLPESLRADVCQDLLLEILEGTLFPENLDAAVQSRIRKTTAAVSPWQERSVESLRFSVSHRGGFFDRHGSRTAWHDNGGGLQECPICLRPFLLGSDHQVCAVIAEDRRRGTEEARQNLTHHYVKYGKAS